MPKKKSKKKTKPPRIVTKRIEALLAIDPITDMEGVRSRMQELYNATRIELNDLAENPDTRVGDLILLRQLNNLIEQGNWAILVYFLDTAFGSGKAFGGIGDVDGQYGNPVFVVKLPANGSESL